MRVIAPEAGREYILEFESSEEMDRFFEDSDASGSFVLPVTGLPADSAFRARCTTSTRTRKIKPYAITQQESGALVRISEPLPQSRNERARTVPREETRSQEETVPSNSDGATVGQSLHDRIHGMTVNDRVMLAMKADQNERRILMQENNLKINEFLLRNPRITEPEIAWLARNPCVPMQTLLAIINHESWMTLSSIKTSVLVNPRTPAHLAQGMIPSASNADLIKMSQTMGLRQDIRAAVLREMKQRGIHPKTNLE
ncbi:MAG TPA: hypothetical protein VFG11_11875 [Acidobacteriota bacterium]|nr:hypothetical protein [Acidobacteriota bacterium]